MLISDISGAYGRAGLFGPANRDGGSRKPEQVMVRARCEFALDVAFA